MDAGIISCKERTEIRNSSGVSRVMEDFDLVSQIVSGLTTPQDRLSASLVCRLWNTAVIFKSQSLVIKSRVLLHCLLNRLPHVKVLDLGRCCDEITDSDLQVAAPFFNGIGHLIIGHPDSPQDRISDEGFHYIASHLPMLQKVVLSCLPNISDRSIFEIMKGCRQLHAIVLENCPNIGDPSLEAISRCTKLQDLTLRGKFSFTPQGLGIIGQKCSSLQRVCFEFPHLEVDFALKSISTRCRRIQELSLKVRRADLGDLAKCTTLTCLRVEMDVWIRLDDMVVAVAVANRNLKELTVVNQYEPLSDVTVVKVMQSCEQLEKLHISAAYLTGTAVMCLLDCKTLKSVTLDHYKSSTQGAVEVDLCAINLNHLSLRSGRGVHDTELKTLLKSSYKLEVLDLQCCHGLSSVGFAAIGQCTNLKSLNLSFTHVDDYSLMQIADSVKHLKTLILVKCESISDMGTIGRFSCLESLNLDQCPFVSDEGLGTIAAGCRQLAHLSLAFTRITDSGLYHLIHCGELQSLKVPYCRYIEGPGLIAISKICKWFRFVVMSHRFRGSKIVEELNKQFCVVRLESDDMALVPFGLNLLM